MVALEWTDVEPLIGSKVSDYIIQHKRVEDPSEAEVYTGISHDKNSSSILLLLEFIRMPQRSVQSDERTRRKFRTENKRG